MALGPVVTTGSARVVHTEHADELDLIERPDVQAVVLAPPPSQRAWLAELDAIMRGGGLLFERAVFDVASSDEVRAAIDRRLPSGTSSGFGGALRQTVLDDMAGLVGWLAARTRSDRFRVRVLAERPSWRCGYHVDTVPPGAPRYGVLRVYNGSETSYLDPADIASTKELYRYVARREHLGAAYCEAVAGQHRDEASRLKAELVELDGSPAFAPEARPAVVVPAGSTVVFKHLDLGLHWSDHDPALAWVHASPMEGDPRLVLNVTAIGRSRRRRPSPAAG